MHENPYKSPEAKDVPTARQRVKPMSWPAIMAASFAGWALLWYLLIIWMAHSGL